MQGKAYGPEDITRLLKERGRLVEFVQTIESRDRSRVAKLLEEVLRHDDGTLTALYLSEPELLADLRMHL